MDPSDFHERVEAVFAAALERPADERAAFLDAACAGAPALRAEVVSLLEAYNEADEFLEAIDTDQAAALLEGSGSFAAPGQHIGPYRLIAELGRGGMGTVYLAERADGHFEHRVALKLIKRGMDSEAILRRFLNERQILARLRHPNIAQLYDGGTEQGQPYFAMEYVEGVALTAYCDAHRLGITDRLRLFMEACRAVQYAHSNLIVHRDLKPSNILVTGEGDLKLLDFGIAKLLDEDPDGVQTITQMGLRAMTPEYAAPEQVRGEPVTTATDVYALGVLLYELLTGRRPYQFERRAPDVIVQVINQARPERPSTVVRRDDEIRHLDGTTETLTPETTSRARSTQPERLRRQLSGDLDTVVMKALRKEPERRYASAEAFLEDIRRHLAGLPVTAQHDTLTYRLRKFAGRHRVALVAALVVVLLGLGLGVLYAVQMARERDAAQRQAARAEQVSGFLIDLFQASDPFEGGPDTMRVEDFLAVGTQRLQDALAEQPDVRAAMMTVIGKVYTNLGRYAEARPLLRDALAIRRQTLDAGHPDLAESLNELGGVLHLQGEYDAADSLYRGALAILQARLGDTHPDLVPVIENLSDLRYHLGDYATVDSLDHRILAIRRAALGPTHPDVARSLNNLGMLARARGDYTEAEALHREALGIARTHFDEDHHMVVDSKESVARILTAQRRYADAEPLLRTVLEARLARYGSAPHTLVSNARHGLGLALNGQGHYAEAEPLLRRALADQHALLGPEHPFIPLYMQSLADALSDSERRDEAFRLYDEAARLHRRLLPANHADLAVSLLKLGGALQAQERYAEAEPLLQEALSIFREQFGPEHPRVTETQQALAAVREAQHR